MVSSGRRPRRGRPRHLHGGSGTILGALGAGVPLAICPLFADQAANARVVSAASAGILVPAGDAPIGRFEPDRIRDAAEQVLERPSFHAVAKAIAAEMSQLPTLAQVLGERLKE